MDLRRLASDYLGMVAALALLILVFGVTARNFFTLTTFRTMANQIPDTTVVAVGMTFVLIIAGIDLSVGSVLALAGAVLGIALVNWAGLCCRRSACACWWAWHAGPSTA